ncbi:MAG: GNAT family N-acetyltransferase [Pyrinomonadaceae bacterium]
MTAGSLRQNPNEVTGYSHAAYAASLAQWGTPRALCRSGGWLLVRPIPESGYVDAMGCYPLFVCEDWSQLKRDLETIDEALVSLAVVTDPFGSYDVDFLRRCFPDLVVPFKQHFVTDLRRAPDTYVHPHHRRNARKALNEMRVEKCDNPEDFLDDWISLYSTLIERHQITGITAFSRQSFAEQLRTPGIRVFRAVHDDVTIGMVLWYQQQHRAYYHLGAYSPLGYDLRASFALFDQSIQYFAEQKIEWLNLGAGAGSGADAKSGLNRFKEGWSTGTRTVYFCGRVFDRDKYEELSPARHLGTTDYFPAYRAGEFS